MPPLINAPYQRGYQYQVYFPMLGYSRTFTTPVLMYGKKGFIWDNMVGRIVIFFFVFVFVFVFLFFCFWFCFCEYLKEIPLDRLSTAMSRIVFCGTEMVPEWADFTQFFRVCEDFSSKSLSLDTLRLSICEVVHLFGFGKLIVFDEFYGYLS